MIWRILILSLIARVFLAWLTPFGVDEAYATAVAREFSWAFFDHPPLGFWAPVAMAKLTGIEHVMIYRTPALIMGSLTTWLIYAIGREIGGERAGIWAAVLHALAPAFVVIGFSVLPDAPLGLGSAIAVLWLVRIAGTDTPGLKSWIWAGLGLALALASKYQAGLIPIAALGFALTHRRGRHWFLTPGPYVASCIGFVGLLPVLLWNYQNDWISFNFHTGRTGDGVSLTNFAKMIAGQGLYLLPVTLVFAGIGMVHGLQSRRAELRLLAMIAILPVVAFNAIYLFSNTSFPHWTMPGWLFALPLAGLWLAQIDDVGLRRVKGWLAAVACITFAVILVVLLHTRFGVLTRFSGDPIPQWDNTVNVFDYSALPGELEKIDALRDVDVLLAQDWIKGGLIASAFGGALPLRVLGMNRHHFAFMDSAEMTGTALLLSPQLLHSSDSSGRVLAVAQAVDPDAQLLTPIILNRSGQDYLRVVVVRLQIGQ